MNRIIMLAALAAAPCLVPAQAEAQNPTPADGARIVRYSDLDLSRKGDVATLDRRIRSAVAAACGPVSDAHPAGKNDVRRCRAETTARLASQRNRAVADARQSVRTALAD